MSEISKEINEKLKVSQGFRRGKQYLYGDLIELVTSWDKIVIKSHIWFEAILPTCYSIQRHKNNIITFYANSRAVS